MTVHLDAASRGVPLPLAELVRELIGVPGARVSTFEGATEGMAALLEAWPAARVGVLPSEYYATRDTLDALSHLEPVELPAGEVDLVVMSHVPSQVGVVNPVRAGRDVPLIVDIAQSAGQLDVRGIPAVAWVGTSRKWLRGPTGVGFVATTLDIELPAATVEEGKEAGLAGAIAAFLADEQAVLAHIARLGPLARRRVAALDGWTVHEPLDSPTGMVTFTHRSIGAATGHRALLDAGIVTSLVPATRARDMTGPVVRASFHTYNDEADVDRLAAVLGQLA